MSRCRGIDVFPGRSKTHLTVTAAPPAGVPWVPTAAAVKAAAEVAGGAGALSSATATAAAAAAPGVAGGRPSYRVCGVGGYG